MKANNPVICPHCTSFIFEAPEVTLLVEEAIIDEIFPNVPPDVVVAVADKVP